MTNLQTTAPRVLPGASAGRRVRVGRGLAIALCALTGLVVLGSGCQQRAGMPCQKPSDCTPGLLCNKPPGTGTLGYGVCEPGLKGLGERCLSSAECDTGLLCSTDLGNPGNDGWHGECQVGSLPDAGTGDLSAADLVQRPD